MDHFRNAYLALSSVNPALPWSLLTLLIFVAVYLSRKFAPKLWVWFDSVTPDGAISHVIQGLPSVGLGAILSVLLTGGDFAASWKGAVWGALAPTIHLILKALPGPYQGAVTAIVKKVGLIALLFLLVGCGATAKQDVKTAVELADGACVLLRSTDPTVAEICAKEEELAPIVKLLSARRAKAKLGAPAPSGDPCKPEES
jgi:hypothetical protein